MLERRARAATRGIAEHSAQQILETAGAVSATSGAAATLEAVRTEVEALEVARTRSEAGAAGVCAFEALETRLALGVDLAAVEGLALLVVADDLVGGVELGEARG